MSYSKPSKTPYRVVLVASLFLLSVIAISVVFRRGGLVETVPPAEGRRSPWEGRVAKSTARREELGRPDEGWPRFRGPNGSATSDERGLPLTWSDDQNIVWKTDLPGPGASSPITTGDRVFVTCYSGYGVEGEKAAKQDDLLRHLVCIDRATGKIVWNQSLKAKLPEDLADRHLMDHGYASSTPATDGERVYVFFGKSGVFAFDLGGRRLWRADLDDFPGYMRVGSGASLVVYGELVIVNASVESSALVALDRRTGGEVWKTATLSPTTSSWSTPILVELADGKQELVTAVPREIWGLNPDTGKLLWYARSLPEGAQCTSLVAGGDVVYVVSGSGHAALAVRAGGHGDVTKTHVVWKANLGAYVPSPVVHDGYLYWVSDRGIACCVKAESGDVVYKERVPGAKDFYASVLLADARLYALSRTQGMFVLAAGPKFQPLAHNELASDGTQFNGSPAVSRGQLLLRSNRSLYCIGGTAKP
ncbi:MAG TPA: PQQ-binding-like beta-propeller repeat protein [Pirellulales bacterium]|nr:PQQ-binding-like beta-propeller repeat protein [Pirellulales bacterium]